MITRPTSSNEPSQREPLYKQVLHRIFSDLKARPAGARLPTEAEYVAMFGVSTFTVRHALSEAMHKGLITKQQGVGSFVAEERPAEKHVALLMNVDLSSENLSSFYVKWLRILQDALYEAGIPHRIYLGRVPLGTPCGEKVTSQELLDDMCLGRLSAVVGWFVSHKPFWGTPFTDQGIPVLDMTYADDQLTEQSVRSVLQYFQQQNRKHIAVLGWESSLDGRYPLSRKIYQLASEYGIIIDEALFGLDANGWEYGMGWERFRDLWRGARKKPDGLYISDNMLFEDCQKAVYEMGISVPEPLCIAVNTSDAYRFPVLRFPVFTWQMSLSSMAEAYVQALKELLKGRPLPKAAPITYTAKILFPESDALIEAQDNQESIDYTPSPNLDFATNQ